MNDVIVIGAGPAGSLSALLLARAGWEVTVLEQHAFPRDKVCGECLSSRGIDILKKHGLFDDLEKSQPTILPKVRLHAAGGRAVSVRLPRPMMGLSRQALDGFLLDVAARAGATVRHRVRCEGVETARRPQIRVRDLVTNEVSTLSASHLIIADGKGALTGNNPAPTGDFGIKSHFVDVDGPRDAIEMFGCADCYGGIAAIENNRWNVSFTVPKARLATVGNRLEALFAQLVAQNKTLQDRMRSATRLSPWIASPIPRYGRQPDVSPTIHRVGNGAAAMEPICGEGMGAALRSAELRVAKLLDSHSSRMSLSSAWQAHRHEAGWWWRRTACRAAGRIAASPPASNMAIGAMEAFRLGPSILRLAGKR